MAAPGVAPVRARFLTSKEQFHAYLRAGGEEEEEEKEKEEEEQVSSAQSEPPAKRVKAEELGQDGESRGNAGEEEKERPEKKRARGQNKSRPCMKPSCYEQSRLCPSVTQGCGGQCHFGPRCRFLHDVSQYLAAKPADLGQRCVLFDTFGRCPYGLTCRFGQSHLGDGHQNLVNAALARQWEGRLLVRNSLSKELQQQLRKRKFSFHKAEEFLRGLRGGKGGKAKGGSTEGGSNCTAPQESLGELQEQGEDPKPEALPNSQGAESDPKPEALPNSQGAEDDPKPEALQSSRGAEDDPKPEALQSSQRAESDPKPEALPNSQGAEDDPKPEALQSSRGAEDDPKPEALQSSQRAESDPKPEALPNSQGAEDDPKPEALQSSRGAEDDPKPEALQSSQRAESDPKPEALPNSQGAEDDPKPEALQSSRGAEDDPKPEALQSSQRAESDPKPEALPNSQGAEDDPKPEALQSSRGAEDDPKPEALQSSQRAESDPKPEALPNSRGAEGAPSIPTLGPLTDEDITKLRPCEKKKLDIQGKLYLAPLTTCGNLPFRRICKRFGADVTCGEMAVCTNLLQGQSSEWALLKRHHTEDIFGVQLEGAFPDTMTKCAELLNRTINVDFVDINVGCPIDLVYKKGGGCALMTRSNKFEQIVRGMNSVLDVPLTVKIRTGVQEKVNVAHKIIPRIREWGASMVTLHGRSREQRYTRSADWDYIAECARLARPMPLFGNGDILSYEDANRAMQMGVSGIMIARGALIKPWLFMEIKEQRHWDISSRERFDILKDFTNYGLEHWGSDTQGVEKTRKFLLEWLSFLCRYIPVGLLEHLPQRINERPPYYLGRDYLETLMASQNVDDWIKISQLLLGPVPPSFTFLPKHKANSYR
ncbi:PREDICTED: tRNA-dihydrouridine(47) synthase [NAD(P)(+)]-like [Ficedula albicollis]|uniref:tRNA-dihydrouridine(47) synthase [NAD(P)(+)] n=1 Tax=Ficedula albicollis TaxID=59894 RepID=U3JF48_FICAL|nr:PREDICTED: tRNA-dihydrouridine(47) synthase [NAD(P)(+)]-like [Ficedula albicollis]